MSHLLSLRHQQSQLEDLNEKYERLLLQFNFSTSSPSPARSTTRAPCVTLRDMALTNTTSHLTHTTSTAASFKIPRDGAYSITFTYAVTQHWCAGGCFFYISTSTDRASALAQAFTNTVGTVNATDFFHAGDDIFFCVDIPHGSTTTFPPQNSPTCSTDTNARIVLLFAP